MTDQTQPSAGTPTDPIDAWLKVLDGTADQIDHVAERLVDGDYSAKDLKTDVETYTAMMLEWSYALEVWFTKPKPLPPIDPTEFTIEMKVFAELADRPLELTTAGFRLVGHGTAIQITPDQVSFEPGTLGKGDDTFVVRVKRGSAGNGIYEGEVTSATGEPVTDKVMPTW